MILYNLLSTEQLDINVKLKKSVGTVFDLSYLLIDFQAVINGLTELIDTVSEPVRYEIAAQRFPFIDKDYEGPYPSKIDMNYQWQKETENKLSSIIHINKNDTEIAADRSREGYKQTTSRRFNKKYRANLQLLDVRKGSLLLDVATPVFAGVILEFLKELIFQKTGKQDLIQINIQNNYININGSYINDIEKCNCISKAIVIKDKPGAVTIDTKDMINHIIKTAKPDDNIEQSVNRLLSVLEENNIIYESQSYDRRGMKTFVRDTDRFIGNLLDIRA